jgi:hypothetical protein
MNISIRIKKIKGLGVKPMPFYMGIVCPNCTGMNELIKSFKYPNGEYSKKKNQN